MLNNILYYSLYRAVRGIDYMIGHFKIDGLTFIDEFSDDCFRVFFAMKQGPFFIFSGPVDQIIYRAAQIDYSTAIDQVDTVLFT